MKTNYTYDPIANTLTVSAVFLKNYLKTWFMDNYSEQPVFDEDGFVVVKTKTEMEAENIPQMPEKEEIAC